jgi:hypothetical protein
MSKHFSFLAVALLVFSAVALVTAQTPTQPQPIPVQPVPIQPPPTTPTEQTKTTTTTTVTKTVQNEDGTYTVIEYPVGKEIKINLTPVTVPGANGIATILRDDKGTTIKLNLTGLPADLKTLNLYAVDNNGAVTLLGPITVAQGGLGTLEANTALSKFMLVASPEANLTAYNPETVFFRSAVPEGFAVIPHTTNPVGEKVAASTADVSTPAGAYTVPMINLPAYKKGDDTKMKIKFSGAMTGARANIFITPRKDGPTEVRLRFHELKEAPAGKVFTAWAVSPDNKFIKLGQVVNTPERNEAEIKSEVALADFGLLITMEDVNGTSVNPIGPSIGIVEIAP